MNSTSVSPHIVVCFSVCVLCTLYTVAIKSPKPTTIERFKKKIKQIEKEAARNAETRKKLRTQSLLSFYRLPLLPLYQPTFAHAEDDSEWEQNHQRKQNTNQRRKFRPMLWNLDRLKCEHRTRSHAKNNILHRSHSTAIYRKLS